MRYRVVFAKRFQSDGTESALDPTAEMDVYIPDGVVADKVFVERFEPGSQHNQEVLDEDDAWLGLASPEVWEYDVLDDREQDFIDAMQNSGTVMEFAVIDETSIDGADAGPAPLGDSGTKAPDTLDFDDDVTRGGSGRRGLDDGPGGQVTGDPSASGMGPTKNYLGNDEVEGIANEGSGGIDDLTIVSADDPSLGLTDYGSQGPDDWAADTGPTHNPGRGIQTGSDK
jgi:hypothetical protein